MVSVTQGVYWTIPNKVNFNKAITRLQLTGFIMK